MTEKQKRFEDLDKRAFEYDYNVYSDFLGLSEISELKEMKTLTPVTLFGGYNDAERVVASFGDRSYFDDYSDFPIKCILIEPLSQKFADNLTHRDFLGSLIGLGIKRETVGDILINNNCGYVFCLETIGNFIIDNLSKVRKTTVKCSSTDNIPTNTLAPEDTEIIVSSLRLDVVVSAVYNLSRSNSQKLFMSEKIFLNGVMKNSPSVTIKENDVVSVRGFGRFIFSGIIRKTKKDRLLIGVLLYK